MKNSVKIYTPKCFHCREDGSVDIIATDEELNNYDNGMNIQMAFPNVPAPIREQIISGTHPKCWDEMMGDGNEQD